MLFNAYLADWRNIELIWGYSKLKNILNNLNILVGDSIRWLWKFLSLLLSFLAWKSTALPLVHAWYDLDILRTPFNSPSFELRLLHGEFLLEER